MENKAAYYQAELQIAAGIRRGQFLMTNVETATKTAKECA